MEKILSIIIPTYNMEALLPRCLDSLIVKNNLDKLEVWVVNDGSKDKSSEIGHKYEKEYPGVFNMIDKPNGNYGSCINAALPKCTGRYVKVLDSDDYFNTNELEKLIDILINTEEDAVLTNHNIISLSGVKVWKHEYNNGEVINCALEVPKYFPMHSILYRTELMNGIEYHQTEGISYTDQEWIFYPMLKARSMKYFDLNVYQYMMDREGQTMDVNVFSKNIHMLYQILNRMLDYAIEHRDEIRNGYKGYCDMNILKQAEIIYRHELLIKNEADFCKENLLSLDAKIKNYSIDLYDNLGAEKIGYTKYISRFRKTHIRLSKKEKSIIKLQKLMKRFETSFRYRVGLIFNNHK